MPINTNKIKLSTIIKKMTKNLFYSNFFTVVIVRLENFGDYMS